MKGIAMLKKNLWIVLALLILPHTAWAGVQITEGEEAAKLYTADKNKAQVLVQYNKEFTLRAPDGQATLKPAAVTLKVGERLYISNEEKLIVHNVYDTSDSSWVLRKQPPSTIALIVFDKPGIHALRCAIHPIMKIDVHVTP
jgi:plastocyanin